MKNISFSQVERALEKAKQNHPEMVSFLEFQHELLSAQWSVKAILPPLSLQGKQDLISERLKQGLPAITVDDLELNWNVFAGLFQKIVEIVRRHRPDFQINSLAEVTQETIEQWYKGSLENEYLSFVLATAIWPLLSRIAEEVMPYIEQELWRRGWCPVCGGQPDFSLLDQKAGSRYLFCSRCDSQWLFKRLECPFCGNDDPSLLAYFTEKSETYRLYVCEICRRWLKAIDLRMKEREILLPLERVLTLYMDQQALRAGYRINGQVKE